MKDPNRSILPIKNVTIHEGPYTLTPPLVLRKNYVPLTAERKLSLTIQRTCKVQRSITCSWGSTHLGCPRRPCPPSALVAPQGLSLPVVLAVQGFPGCLAHHHAPVAPHGQAGLWATWPPRQPPRWSCCSNTLHGGLEDHAHHPRSLPAVEAGLQVLLLCYDSQQFWVTSNTANTAM